MTELRYTLESDIALFLDWAGTDERFLHQWSNFTYPLTREQYLSRLNADDFRLFTILDDGEAVGTIQLMRIDREKRECRVGCFLLNPSLRGKGIGRAAMKLATRKAFDEEKMNLVSLCVYDFNTSAKKCYDACGFVETWREMRPDGMNAIYMELKKEQVKL